MNSPKWIYRLEATVPDKGLWYNSKGEFVLNLKEVPGCETQFLDMSYDERYKQGGHNWFSACSKKEDLSHWYSEADAQYLLANDFVFTKYLAVDYVEYEKETVFRKETSLERVELSLADIYE